LITGVPLKVVATRRHGEDQACCNAL